MIVDRIVQQPLQSGTLLGYVGDRANRAHDFTIRAKYGARANNETLIVPLSVAQAELFVHPPLALLYHHIQHRAKAFSIVRMKVRQPASNGAGQFLVEPERFGNVRRRHGSIACDIPVEHGVTRAGDCQGATLHVRDETRLKSSTRERMLNGCERDEKHDQNQCARQARLNDLAVEPAGHGLRGGVEPCDQHCPRGYEHDRAVKAAERKDRKRDCAERYDASQSDASEASSGGYIKQGVEA